MLSFLLQEKIDNLIDLLEETLGEPANHYSSKAQISFDCPNCSAMKGVEHDHKGNLEVNYELGVYKCWACGETDDTKGFLYKLFKEYATKETLLKFIKLGLVFGDSEYYQNVRELVPKEKVVLPKEYIPLAGKQGLKTYSSPFSYLYSRGITDDDIEKYKLGYAFEGLYQYRIIIPSYDKDGELNYFITRAISPKVKRFKYLNAEEDKTNIIFNEHLIDWTKPVILVEGAFDHIPVGNSIPLLGKKMYDKLFKLIYENAQHYVIIILDPDAWEDAKKIYYKLDGGRLYKKILITQPPGDYDLSLYNQKFGKEAIRQLLLTSSRLKD